ncbi:hypothetical protein EV198_1852 [Roseivirga ehrenbergii]|uniref:CD-NTase-associated protein 13 n=2 Tax=Roseivirga ehrenbergii (strain DSM 102268 / JCM 13514 / KCTC 12282 / NCIMB 14502 / KMM 6017) TaxID=279360 RepID=CAP13_ROSEK|nr:RecName: Full=CD-NTase-associated protein 13; Short=Cap13; AltName: Full=TM-STING; Short=ReSTING [Roseivirga ehrenbergii]TCL10820.1 hypothetical protein EV198_1852 [Roseivirga ehrenbergii]
MKYGLLQENGKVAEFIQIKTIMKNVIANVSTAITLALMILWIKYPNRIEWEAIIGILLVIKEVTIRWQIGKIESLEFSPAISLAHGYVNNFLEPAINELLMKASNNINFSIYIPHDLEELSDQQIDRMKLQIEANGYRLKEIKLKKKTGRPHDLLLVEKQEGTLSYFDFPRTLLSLQSYIDYKVDSTKNEFSEEKKIAMGAKLVDAFHNEVDRLIKKKNLEGIVTFVSKDLELY